MGNENSGRWRDYRVRFPHMEEWQQPVFNDFVASKYPTQVIVAKRQVGKSILAECCALYKALYKKNSISVIVEPSLAQGRRVYKQILKSIGGEGSYVVKSANATLLEIEFINGSQIIFKSAEQRETLRGITVSGVLIIDEAAFIQDDIFELLYPCIDANNAPLILISTPLFTSGEFYNKYLEGVEERLVKETFVKSYDWSEYDTSKYLPKEKLEYYRERLSPLRFRSEYEGKFIVEGSLAMGNINSIIGDYSSSPAIYGGLDWGNGGENDFTVLITLDADAHVSGIYPKNNLTPSQQIDYYAPLISSLNLKAVQVEINSIGEVYYDFLQKGTSVYIAKFLTTNESKRRIVEQLISAIQKGEITVPDDAELLNQLRHFDIQKTKTSYTYNGVGAHDDYVMALAFAYDAWLNNLGTFEISFA